MFIIHLPMKESCGTTNERILALLKAQLPIFTGKKRFIMLM